MFKRLLDFFKSKKQKGQSLVFFAAAIPFLCLFVGASIDFGWMYYNQSRLQNAADSAALIGGRTLVGKSKYKLGNYTYTEMPLKRFDTANFVSNNDPGLLLLQQNSKISSESKDGIDKNKYPYGDSIAKIYALSNLKGTRAYDESDTSQSTVKVKLVDSDNVGSVSGYENIKFESKLWGPNEDDEDAHYYTVTLSTKLDHLFGGIMENFGIAQLPSVATSTVKIFYDGAGMPLYIQMKSKEKNNTFPNWEEIKVQKGNNSTAANNRSVLTGGAYYASGNTYRTEASLLNGGSFASSKGNPYSTGVDQTAFDDLFIDYQGEMNKNLTTNGDEDLVPNTVSGNWDYGDTLANNAKYNFRIHFPVMMVSKYKVRSPEKAPDPIYAFIEQEPIKQIVYQSDGTNYLRGNMSSVRQIIICNDVANVNSLTDRPWVFFYEGPEIPYAPSEPDANAVLSGDMTEEEYYEQLLKMKKQAHSNHPEYYDSDGDYIGERPFLPVILNLYRNFRGIIFAPNNPVIINGNGYKMEGFVVAREFRRLKNYSDFQNAKYADGSDKGKPVYVYPNVSTYKGVSSKNAPFYAEVSNWKTKPSVSSEKGGYNNTSSNTTYTYIKINNQKYYSATIDFNGTTYQGWVKFGQWSTKTDNPDVNTNVKITLADGTTRYTQVMSSDYKSFTDNIFLEAQLKANSDGTYDLVDSGGTTYIAQFDGKYYTPVTKETVTYTGSLSNNLTLGNYFSASGSTIIQKVNTMYVSGTKYKYTESYLNTEGKQKTKTTIMSIGDVQYMNVTASDYSLDANGNVTGNYTETPRASMAEDDKLRYDYVNIFNLNSNSTYSSFNNAQLRNYVYLKKTEKSAMDSHDMFFTTVRSRHIN